MMKWEPINCGASWMCQTCDKGMNMATNRHGFSRWLAVWRIYNNARWHARGHHWNFQLWFSHIPAKTQEITL